MTKMEKDLVKLEKMLSDEFKWKVQKGDVDELKNLIVSLSKDVEKNEADKDADAILNSAKEVVKDLGGGYSDVGKVLRGKVKYILLTMKEKGVDL
jgi:hypothetical protein